MKYAFMNSLGLIALALFTFAPSPAAADAVGPYYATPSWDQTLPASTRFVVLSNLNSQAVLDRETGLVWQRTPDNSFSTHDSARQKCELDATGGREGWRLPAVNELESLIDPTIPFPNTALPSGHPFIAGGSCAAVGYWTATSFGSDPTQAYVVGICAQQGATIVSKVSPTGDATRARCLLRVAL